VTTRARWAAPRARPPRPRRPRPSHAPSRRPRPRPPAPQPRAEPPAATTPARAPATRRAARRDHARAAFNAGFPAHCDAPASPPDPPERKLVPPIPRSTRYYLAPVAGHRGRRSGAASPPGSRPETDALQSRAAVEVAPPPVGSKPATDALSSTARSEPRAPDALDGGIPSHEARRSLKTQQHAHRSRCLPEVVGARKGSMCVQVRQCRRCHRHRTAPKPNSRSGLNAVPHPVNHLDRPLVYWPVPRMMGDDSLRAVLHGEFDPGSGRTLAACLTHASGATNRGLPRGRAANG
jgi:hypothetical protein